MPEEKTICLAQVLFAYEPQASEELELCESQVVRILEQNDAGWWLAADIDGRTGWAPSNFLRELSESEVIMLAQAQGHQVSSDFSTVPSEPVSVQMSLQEVQMDSTQHGHTVDLPKEELPISAEEVVPEPSHDRNLSGAPTVPVENETGTCADCQQGIRGNFVMAGELQFHVDCFKCPSCQKSLAGLMYVEHEGKVYCEEDFHLLFSPRCAKCQEPIRGRYVTALGQTWHENHFTCTVCSQPFTSDRFRKGADNQPYCETHFAEQFGVKCARCSKPVVGSVFEALGKSYHVDCFRCAHDDMPIPENEDFHQHNDAVYCTKHFQDLFLETCETCKKSVVGQFVKVLDKTYHSDCFKCSNCSDTLLSGKFNVFGSNLLCGKCHTSKTAEKSPDCPLPSPAAAQSRTPTQKSASIVPAKTGGDAKSVDAPTQTMKDLDLDSSGATVKKTVIIDMVPIGCENGRNLYRPDQLRDAENLPSDVRSFERELHLSKEDHQALFGMSHEQFNALKLWRKQKMKREVGLF